jgi:DNA-binding transcriptional MerR regulator
MPKSPDAFRTISEVAGALDVPQHVLRFWESKFNQIKPLKRGGGRRYYRPQDVDLLRGIRTLLYNDGFTIKGVQKVFREQGVRFVMDTGKPQAGRPPLPARPETNGSPVGEETNGANADAANTGLPKEDRQKLINALHTLTEARKELSALSDDIVDDVEPKKKAS